jgi:4'-phosphopantetheinyl transferase EntD
MALLSIDNITIDVRLGLWKIDESVDDFYNNFPYLLSIKTKISVCRSVSRQLEMLATRCLLYIMTDGEYVEISHNAHGKPQINGWNISVSHTKGYAAVMLSRSHIVAVDIEHNSNRVSKIADKFIRNDEYAPEVRMQLLHWSAKETIYKLYSEEDLMYFDMRLLPFSMCERGVVCIEDLKDYKTNEVHFMFTDDYVLTYSFS